MCKARRVIGQIALLTFRIFRTNFESFATKVDSRTGFKSRDLLRSLSPKCSREMTMGLFTKREAAVTRGELLALRDESDWRPYLAMQDRCAEGAHVRFSVARETAGLLEELHKNGELGGSSQLFMARLVCVLALATPFEDAVLSARIAEMLAWQEWYRPDERFCRDTLLDLVEREGGLKAVPHVWEYVKKGKRIEYSDGNGSVFRELDARNAERAMTVIRARAGEPISS